MPSNPLTDALNEALPETEEGTVAPAPEASEVEPTQGSEGEVETVATEEVSEEDIPMSYMGVDLSALPAAGRAEIIADWSARDRETNIAQREAAEARKAAAAAPDPAPAPVTPEAAVPETFTDAELAQALGLDAEDPDDARVAAASVPLARLVLDLKAQVENLSTESVTEREGARWQTEVSKLEETYGEMPVDFTTFIEKAADKGITDPEAAYWAEMGPARAALAAEVQKRLDAMRVTGKKGASTPRPRGGVPVKGAPLKSTKVGDAFDEAVELAQKELGYRFDNGRA